MSIFIKNKKLTPIVSFFAFVLFFCLTKTSFASITIPSESIFTETGFNDATIFGQWVDDPDGEIPLGFVKAQYSTNPDMTGATISPAGELIPPTAMSPQSFEINLSGLLSGETYYYKLVDNGGGVYSGIKTFTTLSTDTYIGDVITVTPESTTSLITGTYSKGEFTEIGLGSDTNFIYASYSTDETFASGVTTSPVASFSTMDGYDPDFFGKFTINLFGLSPDTTYYFKLLDNAKTYYGYPENTSAKFTTASAPEETTATVGGTTTESTASCDGEFGYCLLAPLPGLEKITPDINFGDYVNTIFGLIIGLSGAVAVVIIVIAGITYMSSDVITKKSTALSMIWNTLGGIALLLCAYILLNTINPNLVNFKLSINSVNYTLDEQNFSLTEELSSSNPGFTMKGTISSPLSSPGVPDFVNKLKNDGYTLKEISVNAVATNSTENNAKFIASKSGASDIQVVVPVDIGYNGVAVSGTGTPGDGKTPEGISYSWIDREPYLATSTSKAIYSRDGKYNMGAAFVNTGIKDTNGKDRYIGFHGADNNTLKSTMGCIRMLNDDLVALAPYMKTGTKVIIY